MAQTQLYTYRQEDSSFDLTRQGAGIIEKGLYRGFDFVPTADLILKLNQDSTGTQYLNTDGVTLINKAGIFRTSQGAVILDDGEYNLPITSAPVTNPRIDAIVAEYKYTTSVGGSIALIKIIQGAESATPVVPTINEDTEVLLGQVLLPVGVTALTDSGVEYTRNDVTIWHKGNFDPDLKANQADLDALEASKANQADLDALIIEVDRKAPADAAYAYTDTVNEFDQQQRLNRGSSVTATTNTVIPSDGNYFQVTGSAVVTSLSSLRNGTRISLRVLDVGGFSLKHNETIGDPLFKKIISPTGNDLFLIQNEIVELIQDSDGWVVSKIPASNHEQIGTVKAWNGSPLSPPANWALCNGQTINGYVTPNLSGSFVVGYDQGNPDYNAVGNTGGSNSVTLTEAQLPSHSHSAGTLEADALGSEHEHDTPVPLGDTGNLNNSENDAWQSNLNETTQTVNNTTSQHTHSISGETGSAGNGDAIDARPPYYTLAYIVKYR